MNDTLKERVIVMEWTNEKVINEIKKAGGKEVKREIRASWKDYRRFWADKYYTIEENDASEVLRVKFYRAKDIYHKLKSKLLDNNPESFLEGYCLGVRADKDTRDMLFWLLLKNYYNEI
jgi:hypothetical protein